jgi:hypothetical protein
VIKGVLDLIHASHTFPFHIPYAGGYASLFANMSAPLQ